MPFLVRNQQSNWAYILVLVVITTVVAVGILDYAADTIQEINSLSQFPREAD